MSKKRNYNVRGHIRFEKDVADTEKLSPTVYARIGHRTLASAPLDAEGKFDLKFERRGMVPPSSLTLVVGPPVSEGMLTRTNTKQISIAPDEWKESGELLLVEKDVVLEKDIIVCLLPREIKICGVVCKEMPIEGTELTRCCPVPFAKVEVFDVDSLLSIKPIKSKTVKSDIPLGDEFRKIPEEILKIPEGYTYTPPEPVHEPIRKRMMAKSMMGTGETPISAKKSEVSDYTVGKVSITDSYTHIPFYSKDKLGEAYTTNVESSVSPSYGFPGAFLQM